MTMQTRLYNMRRRKRAQILITAIAGMLTLATIGWAGQSPGGPGPGGGAGGGPGGGAGEPGAGPGSGAGGRGGGWGTAVGDATFQIDPDTGNLLVITDDETNLYIQDVIKSLDRPVPQVLIKVLFLEVTHAKGVDLGVEAAFLQGSRNVISGRQTTVSDSRSITDGVFSRDYNRTTEYTETPGFEDTVETIFGTPLQGGFWRIMKDDFEATIHALEEIGKLEVLSRPSIMARNNEPAIITLGQEVPIISNSRVTQDGQIINTVEYVDVGIILEVTPRISPDGLVEMQVAPEISTISGETVQVSEDYEAFVIAKRAAETTVVVPDGMTVVIGGLMEDTETETTRKVPIIGEIPWVGTLFRRKITSKSKTELLIFLTPYVVQQTRGLTEITMAESKRTELAPVAFSKDEIEKHLDYPAYLTRPPEEELEKKGILRRTGEWVWGAVQIFK